MMEIVLMTTANKLELLVMHQSYSEEIWWNTLAYQWNCEEKMSHRRMTRLYRREILLGWVGKSFRRCALLKEA